MIFVYDEIQESNFICFHVEIQFSQSDLWKKLFFPLCVFLVQILKISSVQFSRSVASDFLPMNRSTPGLPVHHQLPEFTQTHVRWVSDVIQPSHLFFGSLHSDAYIWGWCYMHIWGYWYFSWQSWFQLVLPPAQFLMRYSAYKLNNQVDSIQPWCTPFPIWNQSVVACPVLTVASWSAYSFSRGRSGGLVFPSLSEFSTAYF